MRYAFFIGCTFAGVAGWLFAYYQLAVKPSQFDLLDSLWMVGMLIIGGWGSITGAFLGATFLKLLEILFEHLGFKSLGAIAIPGKHGDTPNPDWYHPDLVERPNQKDFQRIAEFVDGVMDNPLVVYGEKK